ncbi:hypothetical protein VKT23_012919 [Stygiomarasmius scandens]|uniref:Uncharacterized protein n=1 Tax=Marasmiellus scandens TaxID=2682957 RepID=A0ABR1J9D9_9AGAR
MGFISTLLVLQSSLGGTFQISGPATATIGQSFTVTWLLDAPSQTQFAIGIPQDDDVLHIDPDFLTTVNTAGQGIGTAILAAPSASRQFKVGAYTLPLQNIHALGVSGPVTGVIGAGSVTDTGSK